MASRASGPVTSGARRTLPMRARNRATQANECGYVSGEMPEPASAPGRLTTHSRTQTACFRHVTLPPGRGGRGGDGGEPTVEVRQGQVVAALQPPAPVGQHALRAPEPLLFQPLQRLGAVAVDGFRAI